MALTFPLSMPQAGVVSNRFEPIRADYLAPEISGRVGGVSGGWPLWEGVFTLGGMQEATADDWRAFNLALRGVQRPFYGADQTRPYPRAYPNGFAGMTRYGGGSFADGTPTSWSVNAARDLLTLNGLPAGLIVSKGDYVGFAWVTGGQQRRHLVRAVEAVTGSALGVATFNVEPPVHTVVPPGATAVLANPVCLMRQTTEARIGDVGLDGSVAGTIQAIQVILP